MPLYGCDCYAYALLASGYVDLVIESGLKVCSVHFHVHFYQYTCHARLVSMEDKDCPNYSVHSRCRCFPGNQDFI